MCKYLVRNTTCLAVDMTYAYDQDPQRVDVAHVLAADIEVLLELAVSNEAPRRLVRVVRIVSVVY